MDERKHFIGLEVDKLLEAVKGSRNEARDRGSIVPQGRDTPAHGRLPCVSPI